MLEFSALVLVLDVCSAKLALPKIIHFVMHQFSNMIKSLIHYLTVELKLHDTIGWSFQLNKCYHWQKSENKIAT